MKFVYFFFASRRPAKRGSCGSSGYPNRFSEWVVFATLLVERTIKTNSISKDFRLILRYPLRHPASVPKSPLPSYVGLFGYIAFQSISRPDPDEIPCPFLPSSVAIEHT